MKRGLFWGLALLVTTLLPGFSPLQASPRVLIESPVFDAGNVPQGSKIVHEFKVNNTGDAPLTLRPKPC